MATLTQPNPSIGRIRGQDEPERPLTLSYVTRDRQALRIGEFVYYPDPEPEAGADPKVLCRIIQRQNITQIPEPYFGKPDLDPTEILEFTGAPDHPLKDYIVYATILGRQNPTGGFQAPRTPPNVGSSTHIAEDDYLETSINKVPYADAQGRRVRGGLHIGHVLDRGTRVKVVLDANSILTTHLAVLAATGQGKSYTVGVLLEEYLQSHQQTPILVLDPHGEYAAMTDATTKLRDGAYAPQVDVRKSIQIRVPVKDLEVGELMAILPRLTEHQEGVIRDAFRDWHHGANHTKAGLLQCIRNVNDGGDEDDGHRERDHHESAIAAAAARFEQYVGKKPYFVDGSGETMRDLLRPGTATILNLSDLDDREQVGLAHAILSLLLKARRMTKNSEVDEASFFHLPYPVLVVAEEAHRLAPASSSEPTAPTLRTILSEGRKFQLGVIVVSQRPGKLDSNVLSQCLSQIVSRISNPTDQEQIRASAEAATGDLIDLLPSLGTGEVVIFGSCVRTPVVAKVRPRVTTHGGTHGDPTRDVLDYVQRSKTAVKTQPTKLPVKTKPRPLVERN